MLLMHANSREDIKQATAGDIVALAGLKHTILDILYVTPRVQFYWNRWNFLIL